ncbi:unnamed protein product [Amoebophrya sp. A120]|nr:unnamed protein product [Amoebophrya sp. A120]|eukprot:GSA120T00022266001.1
MSESSIKKQFRDAWHRLFSRTAQEQKQGQGPFHLLLLGPTGSGKTSFLNLLCNMDAVVEHSEMKIEQFRNFNEITLENSLEDRMASKTSGAKVYDVSFGDKQCGICQGFASDDPHATWVQTHGCPKPHFFHRSCLAPWLQQRNECPTCRTPSPELYHANVTGSKLRVIDTPGFGDSRGFEHDKRHVSKILEAIEGVNFINAICLVINGRESRMNPMLKYVLSQISSIMPAGVINNVFVLFTNANDGLDLNFDMAELESNLLMASVSAATSTPKLNWTFIENPYARVEKAKNLSGRYNASYYNNDMISSGLKIAFEQGARRLEDLFDVLQKPKFQIPIHTNKFLDLHAKKQQIDKNFVDILAQYRAEQDLDTQLDKARKDLEAASNKKQLNENYMVAKKQKQWVTTATASHNTLCNYPGCHCNCHLNCTLCKSFDPEVFRGCAAMCHPCTDSGHGFTRKDHCAECGHAYSYHYHNEVKWEEKEKTIHRLNDTKKKAFDQASTFEQQKRILLESLAHEKRTTEARLKLLKEQLLINVDAFQNLAMSRNFLKVLQRQIDLVALHIEALAADASSIESRRELNDMKAEMEKRVMVLANSLKPQDSSDPAVRENWARMFLGVTSSASQRDIKNAYNRKEKELDPRFPTGCKDAFAKLKRAYTILQSTAA